MSARSRTSIPQDSKEKDILCYPNSFESFVGWPRCVKENKLPGNSPVSGDIFVALPHTTFLSFCFQPREASFLAIRKFTNGRLKAKNGRRIILIRFLQIFRPSRGWSGNKIRTV